MELGTPYLGAWLEYLLFFIIVLEYQVSDKSELNALDLIIILADFKE
mgnify:CR=1 FL=1